MKKKILAISITLALVAVLAAPMAALAANSGTQNASTTQSTSIDIVAKLSDDAVSTITFPSGAPLATVSAPYNDFDGDTDPQFLDASSSEPVVKLKNTSGGALTITLQITGWTNGVVTSEDYELINDGTTTISSVASALSADGAAATVDTTKSISSGAYGDLYLEVTLGDVGSVSGSSTLTILGES